MTWLFWAESRKKYKITDFEIESYSLDKNALLNLFSKPTGQVIIPKLTRTSVRPWPCPCPPSTMTLRLRERLWFLDFSNINFSSRRIRRIDVLNESSDLSSPSANQNRAFLFVTLYLNQTREAGRFQNIFILMILYEWDIFDEKLMI